MSRVRRYFYVSGMRIPTGRGLVDLADGSTRRVILPDEGVTDFDTDGSMADDGAIGSITLKDLVGSDVTVVRVPTRHGVIELPFDATKARGRQGRHASRDAFDEVFASLSGDLAAELALMQIEMMPKSAKSGAKEARMRLAAALLHLAPGTMAAAIQENPDALTHADDEIVAAMFSYDPMDASTLAMWAVGHKRGGDWSLSAADAVNRFSTMVMCSPAVGEELKNSIAKRYVSQLAARALSATNELEMLALRAREGMAATPEVMQRLLHKITALNTTSDRDLDALISRYEYRSMPQHVLDEQAFDAAENSDNGFVNEIITHAGDLVSQEAFEVLLQASPSVAIAAHPDRVTKEIAEKVTAIESVLAHQRPDLLSPAQRSEYLMNPRRGSIARSFAKTMTDQELDRISKAEHQIRAIVDDGAVAPMLINRLIGPRRSLALAMVVADLKENVQLGHDSMDFVTNREERRLIEDALASTDPVTREELVSGLTARDRYDGLFIASQLTIGQLHAALIDAASRLGVLDGDHRAPRAALQSFVSRTDALLQRAGRDDRTALTSGLAYAAELLSGELDGEFSKQFQPAPTSLLHIDAQALDLAEPLITTDVALANDKAEDVATVSRKSRSTDTHDASESYASASSVDTLSRGGRGNDTRSRADRSAHMRSEDEPASDAYDEQEHEFLQSLGEFPDVDILFAALGRPVSPGDNESPSASTESSLFDQDDADDTDGTRDHDTTADFVWAQEYEEAIDRYFTRTSAAGAGVHSDGTSTTEAFDTDMAELLDVSDLTTALSSSGADEGLGFDASVTTGVTAAGNPSTVTGSLDVAVNGNASPVAVMIPTMVADPAGGVIPTVGIQLAIEIRVIAPESPAVAVATPIVTPQAPYGTAVQPNDDTATDLAPSTPSIVVGDDLFGGEFFRDEFSGENTATVFDQLQDDQPRVVEMASDDEFVTVTTAHLAQSAPVAPTPLEESPVAVLSEPDVATFVEAPSPVVTKPLPGPQPGASFDPGFSFNESHLNRLVEEQNARDALERSPQVQPPVAPPATSASNTTASLPAPTASGALEAAVAEYNRLKDEEAVFAVMTTSSKKKAEVRFALKQLKHVEKKIERIQKLVERYQRM